ncbi:MAG TPA: type II toxin-antitoxin system RelE/ParE family toxin [Thermoanaerobaculia bacterium]|nr:type II toxin-antitoxin system RelE/ParE family toxin [Thermoanaerobaculia bacterium]
MRVGDYRIVYDVTSSRLLVEIVRVGHRSAVYD